MVATAQNQDQEVTRTLRLSITGECNLSCFYCRPTGKARELFTPKTLVQPSDVTKLVKIVGEMGITKILLGGGEPLLRKDAPNFIKSALAHKGIQEVRLVTNGTYLKAYADMLRKMGLRRVDINFDSLNFQKYQKITERDDLFRVLDGIEKIEKLNFPEIRLNIFLFNGINQDEIVDFARMTKDRKLHIRFMEYWPQHAAGNEAYTEKLRMSVAAALKAIDSYQRLVQLHDLEAEVTAPQYQFVSATGKMSFWGQKEIEADRKIPRVVFNADGVLFHEASPLKGVPILEDLRRDAKEVRLHRIIEKVLGQTAAPLKKKPEKARPAVSVARSRTDTSRSRRAASAN